MGFVAGLYENAAQGYQTNLCHSGVGVVYTNKLVIDSDSVFWIVDDYIMEEIPLFRRKQLLAANKVDPKNHKLSYRPSIGSTAISARKREDIPRQSIM